MAVKYLCDGCDKEVPYDHVQNISVTVKTRGTTVQAGGDYELCKSCAANMVSQANPKNWTRYAPPPPSRLVEDRNSASGKRVA